MLTHRASSGGVAWLETWRPRLLLVGLLGYVAAAGVGISDHANGASAVTGFVLLAAFTGCLGIIAAWPGRLYWSDGFWLLITGMVLLLGAEAFFAGGNAFYLGAVVAVPVVGRLGQRGVFVGAGFAALALVVPPSVPGWHEGPGWGAALAVVFSAGVAYAFTEIVSVNRALEEAHDQIATLAADGERHRIARDLHDLLGHSLTTITVKAALARRLADRDPEASLQEIAAVEDLSRQALADVRAAIGNYRDVTLVSELARGAELLRASAVAADLPRAVELADSTHDQILGWVVREGLTNVVRHAQAHRCTVTLTSSGLDITDDGVATDSPVYANGSPTSAALSSQDRSLPAAGACGYAWTRPMPGHDSDRPPAAG